MSNENNNQSKNGSSGRLVHGPDKGNGDMKLQLPVMRKPPPPPKKKN